jgi:CO/xanthine dehydrogenase Mo-binding subunit
MARHRGRGVASINYPIGMNLGGDPSQALVHSNPSGKFTVALSSIDLGQGMKSVTRQMCAGRRGVRGKNHRRSAVRTRRAGARAPCGFRCTLRRR